MFRNKNTGRDVQDHGGDIYRSDKPVILDFSASINPLGQPEGLLNAIAEGWHKSLHYPDRRSEGLKRAISLRYGVADEHLAVGNGSTELIDLVFRALAPKRIVLSVPDFGLYEDLAPAEAELIKINRLEDRDFSPDYDALAATAREGDLFILSNPANPSGKAESADKMAALARALSKAGAWFVADESFCDFCPAESIIGQAGRIERLVVMRSLTKFYGIPGVRLGFMAADGEFVSYLEGVRPPWSVSSIAQSVGEVCLADDHWSNKTREYVGRAREKLLAALANFPGFTPLETHSNYVMVRLTPPAPNATGLYQALLDQGMMIRHLKSFGLGERYVRIAVRTVGENADLARSIKKLTEAR